MELRLPLLPQAGRRHDEHPRVRRPDDVLGNDQARLDRLAESDFIGDEHAAGVAASDGDCRLELKRQNREMRPRGGAERGPVRYGVGEDRARGSPPARERDNAWRSRP